MPEPTSRILTLASAISDLINQSSIVPVLSTVSVIPDSDLNDLSKLLVCVTPYSFRSETASRSDGTCTITMSVIIASPADVSAFPLLMSYTDSLVVMLEQAHIKNCALQNVEFKPVYDSGNFLENGLYLSIIRLTYKMMWTPEE